MTKRHRRIVYFGMIPTILGVLFSALGWLSGTPQWHTMGRWALMAGLAGLLLSLVTGLQIKNFNSPSNHVSLTGFLSAALLGALPLAMLVTSSGKALAGRPILLLGGIVGLIVATLAAHLILKLRRRRHHGSDTDQF